MRIRRLLVLWRPGFRGYAVNEPTPQVFWGVGRIIEL